MTRRFGPTRAEYDAVAAWLRGAGMRLLTGSRDRLTITVRGDVAEAERAFAVRIGEPRVGRRGVYAPVEEPAAPRRLARYVRTASGRKRGKARNANSSKASRNSGTTSGKNAVTRRPGRSRRARRPRWPPRRRRRRRRSGCSSTTRSTAAT
ncbi:MAG: protease pro-enzyme activation domain-containing protein [Solirubrobacteraceae bacterium]